jgi:transcription elongation factor
MVISQKDGVCVILSDATKEELKVFDRDVSDAAAANTMGVDLLGGQYQLHDFVQLDEKTVGLVLEVRSSTAALVLTNQGTGDQADIRTCKVGCWEQAAWLDGTLISKLISSY